MKDREIHPMTARHRMNEEIKIATTFKSWTEISKNIYGFSPTALSPCAKARE